MNTVEHGLHGYCSFCNKEHHLPAGNSKRSCLELMQRLEREERLDFLSPESGNIGHSTQTLFGEARGKMFGVLEGLDDKGTIVILYAFSGQYNGHWNIAGWVPPIFDEIIWQKTNFDTEKKIKEMGRELDNLTRDSEEYLLLKQQRKESSQGLMRQIHSLYVLRNFRGQTSALFPLFNDTKGIPTGTGDCCAPKLLNYAQQNNIIPLGISEFYWGRTNKSGTRHHGHFYPACQDKCQPVMGFMLCGLEEKRRQVTSLR